MSLHESPPEPGLRGHPSFWAVWLGITTAKRVAVPNRQTASKEGGEGEFQGDKLQRCTLGMSPCSQDRMERGPGG